MSHLIQIEVKDPQHGINYIVPNFNADVPIPGAPHFTFWEAANPSCKEATKLIVSSEFYKHAEMIEAMRIYCGFAWNPTSWYRSPSFNKSVGGIDTSNHLKGTATDVPMKITEATFKVYASVWKAICESNGVVGEIIWYKNRGFVHFGSFIDYSKKFTILIKA